MNSSSHRCGVTADGAWLVSLLAVSMRGWVVWNCREIEVVWNRRELGADGCCSLAGKNMWRQSSTKYEAWGSKGISAPMGLRGDQDSWETNFHTPASEKDPSHHNHHHPRQGFCSSYLVALHWGRRQESNFTVEDNKRTERISSFSSCFLPAALRSTASMFVFTFHWLIKCLLVESIKISCFFLAAFWSNPPLVYDRRVKTFCKGVEIWWGENKWGQTWKSIFIT